MGAAILAAAGSLNQSVAETARRMVRSERQVRPNPDIKAAYDQRYARFVQACRDRGYLA